MDKRYQVFISSTYKDLENERRDIIQSVIELDCIPAGMELFPAVDEEQWAFIMKVMDDCDYYLLLLGGRYGSTDEDGISYTEKEFDYAVQKGIKVIALLHDNPGSLPYDKSETEPEFRDKLEAFREKVKRGRLIAQWSQPEELPALVMKNLAQNIKKYPAAGWIRATEHSPLDLLSEVNALRKKNNELSTQLEGLQGSPPVQTPLACGEDVVRLRVFHSLVNGKNESIEIEVSWNEIVSLIGPELFKYQSEDVISKLIQEYLCKKSGKTTYNWKLERDSFNMIKVQLFGLGYIGITAGPTHALFWILTATGKTALVEIRGIKVQQKSKAA